MVRCVGPVDDEVVADEKVAYRESLVVHSHAAFTVGGVARVSDAEKPVQGSLEVDGLLVWDGCVSVFPEDAAVVFGDGSGCNHADAFIGYYRLLLCYRLRQCWLKACKKETENDETSQYCS